MERWLSSSRFWDQDTSKPRRTNTVDLLYVPGSSEADEVLRCGELSGRNDIFGCSLLLLPVVQQDNRLVHCVAIPRYVALLLYSLSVA